MRVSKKLSGKRAAFAHAFAVTGNATRSALAAGYKPGRGIWTTAWRLQNDAEICREVERIRSSFFKKLRTEVSLQLRDAVMGALVNGLRSREGRRAVALCQKIGLFDWQNKLAEARRKRIERRHDRADLRALVKLAKEAEGDERYSNLAVKNAAS